MTRRPLRLLGAATSLAVVAALAPGSAGAASADEPAPRPATSARVATDGVTVGTTTVRSTTFATVTPSAGAERRRATQWPVGGSVADLTTHPDPVSGDASQRIVRTRMIQWRARGGVIEGVVDLGAAPTAATPAQIVLAFGKVTADGTVCDSPANYNVTFSSVGSTSSTNPVYRGAQVRVVPTRLPGMTDAGINCAFAQSLNGLPTTPNVVKYDSVAGGTQQFRQKPILSVRVKGRKLKRQGWTRVPIIIRNSPGTVATAHNTRLSWKARGVAVRGVKRVGTIKPGAGKRGSFLVRDTRRGNGKITFTVRSGDYRVKLTVKITQRRRR